ncbi:MAG: isoprenylcysteine carboxylmethyltransferase family protein [bacterium]
MATLLLTASSFFLNSYPLQIPYSKLLKEFAGIADLITYPVLIWALMCLKSCLTVIPEAHKVVATGIYKYSRHPLYVIYIIWALLNILLFQSMAIIIITSIYIGLMYLRIKIEESLLLETFPEYREYYNNTGLIWIDKIIKNRF